MHPADIEHRFAYHAPTSPIRASEHASVRESCSMLAGLLNDIVPEGREKALALTKLEEVMFWANAAIART